MKYSLAFLCGLFFLGMAQAHAAESEASIERIGWASAPGYIQRQAKNVVLHCSSGEYTPNQVMIYKYSNPASGQDNYVLDFSAMKGLTQQLPSCNYNSPVCGPQGCFLMAYTEIKDGVWDQSWFGLGLKIKVIEIEQNNKSFPAMEVTQGPESCLIVNGGKANCPMHFTWLNNKFKYYGYAKLDMITNEGTPTSVITPIIPPSADEPEQSAPSQAAPQAPASEAAPEPSQVPEPASENQ